MSDMSCVIKGTAACCPGQGCWIVCLNSKVFGCGGVVAECPCCLNK